MKKRTVFIRALFSFLPLVQSLMIGTVISFSSLAVILSTATEVIAENADYYYNQGIFKRQRGDNQGAIIEYTKAINMYPQFVMAYVNRGVAKYSLTNDWSVALEDFNKAVKIDPSHAIALNNRGYAKRQIGDYRGALLDFNKAIKSDPEYINPYGNRAWVRFQLGDKKGSCNDYKKAASFGNQRIIGFLNSENGNWCRNM